MSTKPKVYKFTFTYADIAKVKRVTPASISNAVKRGAFNPNDLGSITRFIYGDCIRDLKVTLNFWKKKGESNGKK